MNAHVLIADDEPLIRQSLRTALLEEGFAVTLAASGADAWQLFQRERPDLVILDLVLGDMDGLDLLGRMKKEAPDTKALIITAYGSIERAVAAMKMGGYDFIRKPFDLEEILAAVRNAVRIHTLERRFEYLQQRGRAQQTGMIYGSTAMKDVAQQVLLIAQNPVPVVLVLGESGSGKQLIARMLHDHSQRADGPFVELNCSAIPENLVESELFGYERGAFSDARERKLGLVEIADGGTLFLDEVGDLGPAAQAKLLTFLEQRVFRRVGGTALRRVDVRIVAATNRDLVQMAGARTFREDLWYRLSAMILRLPPLRERPDDIPLLAEHFLKDSSREFNRRWQGLAPETAEVLRRYRWPGNVRELRAVVSRAALLQDGELLLPRHLPPEVAGSSQATPPAAPRPAPAEGEPIPTLAEVELAHIRRVLEQCGGNRTVAAQALGITRQTLVKKLGDS